MVRGDTKVNIVEKLIHLNKETPARILVIGDSMTDVYVHGKTHLCQEGCLKFVRESSVEVPGGAANAIRSISNWHTRSMLCSPQDGPIKTRLMVDDKCVFRYDDDRVDGDLDLFRKESLATLLAWRPSIVLLSDYDKGMLTIEFIRKVIDTCKKYGILCIADAKREPVLYSGAIIKGNWSWSVDEAFQPDVVTCGKHPPMVDGNGIFSNSHLPDVNCLNHVGAGDCFGAHLALALSYGFSLKESAGIAHSAGRVYVQHRHNRPPMPGEILEDYSTGQNLL